MAVVRERRRPVRDHLLPVGGIDEGGDGPRRAGRAPLPVGEEREGDGQGRVVEGEGGRLPLVAAQDHWPSRPRPRSLAAAAAVRDDHLRLAEVAQGSDCRHDRGVGEISPVVEAGDVHGEAPDPPPGLDAERLRVDGSSREEGALEGAEDAVGEEPLGLVGGSPAASASATSASPPPPAGRRGGVHRPPGPEGGAGHGAQVDPEADLAVVGPVPVRGGDQVAPHRGGDARSRPQPRHALGRPVRPGQGEAERAGLGGVPAVGPHRGTAPGGRGGRAGPEEGALVGGEGAPPRVVAEGHVGGGGRHMTAAGPSGEWNGGGGGQLSWWGQPVQLM